NPSGSMEPPPSPGVPFGLIDPPDPFGVVGAGAPSGSIDTPELPHRLVNACQKVPRSATACWGSESAERWSCGAADGRGWAMEGSKIRLAGPRGAGGRRRGGGD